MNKKFKISTGKIVYAGLEILPRVTLLYAIKGKYISVRFGILKFYITVLYDNIEKPNPYIKRK